MALRTKRTAETTRGIVATTAVVALMGIVATAERAHAQETATTATPTTTTTMVDEHEYLNQETFSLKPEMGVMEFTDSTGEAAGRFAAGVGLDLNIVALISPTPYPLYYGISTGALFSHLGAPSAGFFGSSPEGESGGLSGANAVVIPVNFKLGYDITDLLRVSVHAGGNVFYRSVGASMDLGASSAVPESNWNVYPNFGADFELAVGSNTAVLVRPDWTITPGSSVFLGTVGLSVLLG